MVQKVKELAAELQPATLVEGHHLEDGAVDVGPSRPAQDVAAAVAIGILGRIRPRRARSEERSVEPARDGRVGEFAGTDTIGTAAAGGGERGRKRRRKCQATLNGKNPVNLPTAGDSIGQRISDRTMAACSARRFYYAYM